jgi:shikimate dehydrogenase
VIGDPVAHSLSPAIHNAAFEATGIDGVFVALPVRPDDLAAAVLPLPADALRSGHVVVDLVYEPVESGLLAAARSAGARTVDGVGMLVHQAAHAFHLWTGVEPPIGVMESAARAALVAKT